MIMMLVPEQMPQTVCLYNVKRETDREYGHMGREREKEFSLQGVCPSSLSLSLSHTAWLLDSLACLVKATCQVTFQQHKHIIYMSWHFIDLLSVFVIYIC